MIQEGVAGFKSEAGALRQEAGVRGRSRARRAGSGAIGSRGALAGSGTLGSRERASAAVAPAGPRPPRFPWNPQRPRRRIPGRATHIEGDREEHT